MSNIKMTVKQCIDLGLWEKYCNWSNTNQYAINEGLIDYDNIIEFDSEFKKQEKDIESLIIYGKEYIRKNEIVSIIKKVEFNFNFENYSKFLIGRRYLESDEINFELYDLEQIEKILYMDEY